MPSSSPKEYRSFALRIVQHELGHFIAGRILGFGFDGMTLMIIGPLKGHRGEAAIKLAQRVSTLEETKSYLRRRIKVLYAGAPAEALGESLKVNVEEAVNIIKHPGLGAAQDYAKVRELVPLLRDLEYPDTDPADDAQVKIELDSIEPALWAEAVELIEAHAAAIKSVAAQFVDRIKVPGDKLVITPEDLESFPEIQAIPRTA